jgi:hypothetical protein
MNIALGLALALSAAPVRAQDAAPAAPAASTAPAAGADASGNGGVPMDGGVTPYGLKDFDEVAKQDLKQMESDLKATVRALDDQYDEQADMESGQMKARLKFLRGIRDERVRFEKDEIGRWKTFVEHLRKVEPAERGTEKMTFDQDAADRRGKLDEKIQAENVAFREKQNAERDAFWKKVQKENFERQRLQQEHATKWGKPSGQR